MAKMRFKETSQKYEKILSYLKKKNYKPVYLLMGEEPLYIDLVSDYIAENVLEPQDKAFNQLVLYGKDTDVKSIVFAASRPPMMAKYQVVIVKEAQNLKFDSSEQSILENYVKNSLSSTILALCFKGKTVDKRYKVYKEIESRGVVLETVKLYENELPGWISSYMQQKGANIENTATAVLAEHIGNDLNRIINELDKLFILLPENRRTITVADIEKNIGISKEYNVFELGNALFAKNVLKANRIVNYFGQNPKPNPMNLIISSLFAQFVQLLKYQTVKSKSPQEIASILGVNPYFLSGYQSASYLYSISKVVRIISLLREYDMRSKGWNDTGTPQGELLKELVFKIMH